LRILSFLSATPIGVPCGTRRDTTTDIPVMVRCGCHVWFCESERRCSVARRR